MKEDMNIEEELNKEELKNISGGRNTSKKECPKCGFKAYDIDTKVCSHCGYRSHVRR